MGEVNRNVVMTADDQGIVMGIPIDFLHADDYMGPASQHIEPLISNWKEHTTRMLVFDV